MNWTAGYASDVEYIAGFYSQQAPALLNFVCALNGVEPVARDRDYTYFELGFGRGLTVTALAAANPDARFYAADFNPAHVAGAQALADEAGIANLTLLENSFEELAAGAVAGLPQFDFITLHGIYTWVTAENRRHIIDFVTRYLKPGGIVYISYNAMPGWAAAQPLQRLLVEYGDTHPGRSDHQVAAAVAFAQQLADSGASYFATNPMLASRMSGMKTAHPHYLVHEYMHRHWQPMYHADVARDLSNAKLDFAGSAELPFSYPKLYLSDEKQKLIASMPDPHVRETLKDYCTGTTFRKDVFVRGARRMAGQRRREWLERTGLALLVPLDAVKRTMSLIIGEVTSDADVFTPICQALAERPHTLGELAALPALAGRHFEDIVQTAALLAASSQASVYGGAPSDYAPAQRLNRVLAARALVSDELQALCSPLLGNGVSLQHTERVLFSLLSAAPLQPDPAHLAREGWGILHAQGRRMLRDGVALDDPKENEAELLNFATVMLRDKLPLWRKLRLL